MVKRRNRNNLLPVRYLVSCFSFFLFTQLCAQKIRPFQDYSKCFTGFRNESGDTVVPANYVLLGSFPANRADLGFTETNIYPWDYIYNYILADGTKIGVLNENGKWTVQPQYEAITFEERRNCLLIKDKGKYGVCSLDGTVKVPAIYDTVFTNYGISVGDTTYFVKNNGLTGLCSDNGREIIPLAYERLDILYYYEDSLTVDKMHFGKTGDELHIYDPEGQRILTTPAGKVREFTDNYRGHFSKYFILETEKRETLLFDKTGKIVVPLSDYRLYAVYTLSALRHSGIKYAKQYDEAAAKMRMLDLESGKKSAWFDNIQFLGNAIITKNAAKWQVLDTNFNVVFGQTSPEEELVMITAEGANRNQDEFPSDGEWETLWEYYEFPGNHRTPVDIGKIYLLKRTFERDPIRINGKKVIPPNLEFYGIVDISTGKLSPVIYSDIVRIGANNDIYYWAVYGENDQLGDQPDYSVDVYNSNGQLLRSFCIDYITHRIVNESRYGFYGHSELPLLAAASSWRQTGSQLFWIDGSQPEIHHFEDIIADTWVNNDSTGYVLLKNDKKELYFVNIQGKPGQFDNKRFARVEPVIDDRLGRYSKLVGVDSSITVVNEKLVPLLDNCSKVERLLYPVKLKNSDYLYVLAEKSGLLYGLLNGQFLVLDSTLIYGENGMKKITGNYTVDNKGRLLSPEEVLNLKNARPGHVGRFKVSIQNSTLQFQDLELNKTHAFADVARFKITGSWVEVKSTKGKMGFIDGNKPEWLIKPIYDSVVYVHYERSDYFMARDKGVHPSAWFAVKNDGTRVNELFFDQPVMFEPKAKYAFAKSNDRVGTVNNQFNWITPPVYAQQHTIRHFNVLVNKNSGDFVDENGKTVTLSYDSINLAYTRRMILFAKDSIEIRDENGGVLLPRMKKNEAILQANFRAILNDGVKEPLQAWQFIKGADSIPVLRHRNNENVLENSRWTSLTQREVMMWDREKEWKESLKTSCLRAPKTYSARFYVEMTRGACYGIDRSECLSEGLFDGKYTNYRIENDRLIEIRSVEELFLPGSGYEAKLDSLLEQAIQKSQLLGIVCADIPGTIEQLKKVVVLQHGGIGFVDCRSKRMITVSTDEMKGFWKDETFLK